MKAAVSGGSSSRSASASSTLRCPTSRAFDPNQRWETTHSLRTSSETKPSSMGEAMGSFLHFVVAEHEPEEPARGERQQVRQLADAREARAAEHLLRDAPLVRA